MPVAEELQVAWNMSDSISQQIANHIRMGSYHKQQGNIDRSFDCFEEIMILIIHHLDVAQRKDIYGLEKKFHFLTNRMREFRMRNNLGDDEDEIKERGGKTGITYFKLRKLRGLILKDYRIKVISLLTDYGYLMQFKQDSKSMF